MSQAFKKRILDYNPLEIAKASKCSYCCRLMRQEVYSCTNGHHGCEFCMSKMNSCPVCQIPFVQKNGEKSEINVFRDHEFEQILNSLKFPCIWEDKGCTGPILYRWDVGRHQVECRFNKESFKVCQLFSDINQELCYNCPKWCPIESADPRLCRSVISSMWRRHGIPVFLINIGEQVEFILKPLDPSYYRNQFERSSPKKTAPWRKYHAVYLADITIRVPVVHSDKCTIIYTYILVSRHIFQTIQESFLSWTLVEITPESELLPRSFIHLDACQPKAADVPKPKLSLSYRDRTSSNNLKEFIVSIKILDSTQPTNCPIPTVGLVQLREIVTSSDSRKHNPASENYFSTSIRIQRDFKLDWNGERDVFDFERIQADTTRKYSENYLRSEVRPINDKVAVRIKFTDIILKQRQCVCNTSPFDIQEATAAWKILFPYADNYFY